MNTKELRTQHDVLLIVLCQAHGCPDKAISQSQQLLLLAFHTI